MARAETEAMTPGEWAATWLAALEADPRRSRATVVPNRAVLSNHVLPELGEVRLVDLTAERVAEHLATLARRPSRRHPTWRHRSGCGPSPRRCRRTCRSPSPLPPGVPSVSASCWANSAGTLEHPETYTPTGRTAPVLAGLRGARVSQTALDKAWRAAREEAGRPSFRFHNLRHTGLSKYAEQGATLAELLHRGGHTDVSVALPTSTPPPSGTGRSPSG